MICVLVQMLRQKCVEAQNRKLAQNKEDHVMLMDSVQFIGNILKMKDLVLNSKMHVMQITQNVNSDIIHH